MYLGPELIKSEDDRLFVASVGNWNAFTGSGSGSLLWDPTLTYFDVVCARLIQGGGPGTWGIQLPYPAFSLKKDRSYLLTAQTQFAQGNDDRSYLSFSITDGIQDLLVCDYDSEIVGQWLGFGGTFNLPDGWIINSSVIKLTFLNLLPGNSAAAYNFSLKQWITGKPQYLPLMGIG